MSGDLNITRPSTRLHAPPGGSSSISFGDAPASKLATPAPVVTNTGSAAASTASETIIEEPTASQSAFKITVVTNTYTLAPLEAALSSAGISFSIVEAPSLASLPYVVQSSVTTSDGVLAIGVIGDASDAVLGSAVAGALYQIGLTSGHAVIPVILSDASALETTSAGLVDSLNSVLKLQAAVQSAPGPVVVESPVPAVVPTPPPVVAVPSPKTANNSISRGHPSIALQSSFTLG